MTSPILLSEVKQAMNRRMVLSTVGKILKVEAVLLFLPMFVSLFYKETECVSFLLTAIISFAIGTLLAAVAKPKNHVIYAREGFLIVSFAWVAMSAIGALPFVISREIPSYVDAFFETVSGFTTTGASILTNVESLSRGMLFWRSFTHWIGGMGVLVFVMAISKSLSDRAIHIMRAEVPGPVVGKIVPRMKDTAKILYKIYIGMTVLEIILLLCGGMPIFDSLVHTFGTAGTGGFGIKADSIAGYSPYIQWVIAVFMMLFGINFHIYYLIIIKKFRSVLKSTELWVYLSIILISVGIITVNIYPLYGSIAESLRQSAFQTSSVITTTGFVTTDFNLWPQLSKSILLVLMFIGACAGSTGGGLKVSRLIILAKIVKREIKRLLHPRSVGTVNFEGKSIDEQTVGSVGSYFALYCFCVFAAFLLISFEPFDFETNFSAVVACFNNIGPGFGMVGPAGSFADYSAFSKIVLSLVMLLGRLEIFPLFIALIPSTWRKN